MDSGTQDLSLDPNARIFVGETLADRSRQAGQSTVGLRKQTGQRPDVPVVQATLETPLVGSFFQSFTSRIANCRLDSWSY